MKLPLLVRSVLTALASVVLGVAVPVHARATDGAVPALEPDQALLVLKTEWWQPAPAMRSAFRLTLSSYDPVQQKLLGKPFGGSAEFAAQKKKYVDGYLVVRVKPGRWAFQSYSQQDKWALCFNAASLQFDVRAGEIVYLGEFDALRHRAQLTERVISSGRTSMRGTDFADFFDLAEGPHLGPIDRGQLDAVRDMLGRHGVAAAAVTPAAYQPAVFGTGSTLFAERKCGGYFATGAKK